MEKYDVQINFTVVANSEEDAIFELQWFLRGAILESGADSFILDHDLLEFIPNEQGTNSEADAEGSNL